MDDPDLPLIERLKAGDTTAIEPLFARHRDRLFRFASKMCRHTHDAEDVLQETFLSALQHLKGFRGRARVTTWLYTVASHACLKKRRGPAVESLGDGNGPAPHQEPADDWSRRPDEVFRRKETGRALADAIAAVPADHRLVLVLRDMEGLSAPEVSRIVGISVSAVKSRLHRARIEVRHRLTRHFSERAQ